MTDIYNDPDLASSYFKFESVGDEITGDVIDVRKGQDYNQLPCPELVLRKDDGADIKVGCGQAQLKAKVLSLRPVAGDRIRIKFSGTEKAAKGEKKLFDVDVNKGGAKGTKAAGASDDPLEAPF